MVVAELLSAEASLEVGSVEVVPLAVADTRIPVLIMDCSEFADDLS